MIRIFGGIISWVSPHKVVRDVVETPRYGVDIAAHLLGVYITAQVMWFILSIVSIENFKVSFFNGFAGSLFLLPVTLGITFFITMIWSAALKKSKVKGTLLNPNFTQLFSGHLHIYAVLMPVLIITTITEQLVAFALLAIVLLRTFDLEARVIQTTCNITLSEAYKGTTMILLVYGGIAVVVAWLLLSIF